MSVWLYKSRCHSCKSTSWYSLALTWSPCLAQGVSFGHYGGRFPWVSHTAVLCLQLAVVCLQISLPSQGQLLLRMKVRPLKARSSPSLRSHLLSRWLDLFPQVQIPLLTIEQNTWGRHIAKEALLWWRQSKRRSSLPQTSQGAIQRPAGSSNTRFPQEYLTSQGN